MIRRLLQSDGAEVVHLGHNRSVADIVRAAIEEDADGIAVSSYQGGHNEYFRYMVDMLREQGAQHIRVVVGGGGTIAPHEIEALEAYGVEKIYTPEDGRRLGSRRHDRRRVRARRRPARPASGTPSCMPASRDHRRDRARDHAARRWRHADGAEADDLRRALSAGRGRRRAARPSSASPAPAAPARAR